MQETSIVNSIYIYVWSCYLKIACPKFINSLFDWELLDTRLSDEDLDLNLECVEHFSQIFFSNVKRKVECIFS